MSKIREIILFNSRDYIKDGIKDKKRVSNHGEVYTPENIVNDMIDLTCDTKDEDSFFEYVRLNMDGTEEVRRRNLGGELNVVDKIFLEPACGNGNFLVAIIERKLMRAVLDAKANKSDIKFGVFKSFATTYGIDILADNILEARQRMLEEIISNKDLVSLLDKEDNTDIERLVKSIQYVMDKNIILGDFLTHKYVEDTSTRGKNKLNKGLKDEEIKVYNWKTSDTFDESGFIKLTYASFENLEDESMTDNDKYYLDYELEGKKSKAVKKQEDESLIEEFDDTKKKGRKHRHKNISSDEGLIPDGL